MSIPRELKSVKTVAGLYKYVKSNRKTVIRTIAYGELYWIIIGDREDNLFIDVNFLIGTSPRIEVTERRLAPEGSKDIYETGESVYLYVSNTGKKDFVNKVFNELYG